MTIPVRPATAAAVVRNPAGGHGLRLVLQQVVVLVRHPHARKVPSSSLSSYYYYCGGVARAPAAAGGSSCGFATLNRKSPLPASNKRALAASARPRSVDSAHDGGQRPSTVPKQWSPAASSLQGRGAVPPLTIPQTSRHSPVSPVAVVGRTSGPPPQEEAVAGAASSAVAAPASQPQTLTYVEGATMPITSRLHLVTPDEDIPRGIWPVFRLMVRTLGW